MSLTARLTEKFPRRMGVLPVACGAAGVAGVAAAECAGCGAGVPRLAAAWLDVGAFVEAQPERVQTMMRVAAIRYTGGSRDCGVVVAVARRTTAAGNGPRGWSGSILQSPAQ